MYIPSWLTTLFIPVTSPSPGGTDIPVPDTGPRAPDPSILFIPTKDFYSEEFRSQYMADLIYRAVPSNAKLQASVAKWEQQGLVRRVDDGHGAARARLHGKGRI